MSRMGNMLYCEFTCSRFDFLDERLKKLKPLVLAMQTRHRGEECAILILTEKVKRKSFLKGFLQRRSFCVEFCDFVQVVQPFMERMLKFDTVYFSFNDHMIHNSTGRIVMINRKRAVKKPPYQKRFREFFLKFLECRTFSDANDDFQLRMQFYQHLKTMKVDMTKAVDFEYKRLFSYNS